MDDERRSMLKRGVKWFNLFTCSCDIVLYTIYTHTHIYRRYLDKPQCISSILHVNMSVTLIDVFGMENCSRLDFKNRNMTNW
jgi:hypothetical protein